MFDRYMTTTSLKSRYHIQIFLVVRTSGRSLGKEFFVEAKKPLLPF